MRRVAVKIAYLGDGFSGSQIQPNTLTVESEVISNLELVSRMSREDIDLRFSSRTDKGVNALGNAIAFYTPFEDDIALLRALNSVSDSVFYRSIAEVDSDFNPRHASRRRYRYVLPAEGLDVDSARECAELFVGEHDFQRFCRPDGKPTTATIDSIDVSDREDTVVLEFTARYFLWNMIRRISAAIDSVARGRSSVDEVRLALEGQDRTFGVARPDALTLVDVEYDWMEFTDAASEQISDRVSEGLFREELRKSFLESI